MNKLWRNSFSKSYLINQTMKPSKTSLTTERVSFWNFGGICDNLFSPASNNCFPDNLSFSSERRFRWLHCLVYQKWFWKWISSEFIQSILGNVWQLLQNFSCSPPKNSSRWFDLNWLHKITVEKAGVLNGHMLAKYAILIE